MASRTARKRVQGVHRKVLKIIRRDTRGKHQVKRIPKKVNLSKVPVSKVRKGLETNRTRWKIAGHLRWHRAGRNPSG